MRLGLTGGIASGKSTASAFLVTLGWQLVDTDAIARNLTARQGAALPLVAARFGADLLSPEGELDRALLRERVFRDPDERLALEALLHPLIQAQAERQAAAAPKVLFDVPLLVESRHWRARVDRVLLIDCDEGVQRQRALARGWSEAQVDGVLVAQATRGRRRAAADAIIDNSQLPIAQFQGELLRLMEQWGMKESGD